MNTVTSTILTIGVSSIAGYIICRLTNPDYKRLKNALTQLKTTQSELEVYRAKVSCHFKETAVLMEKLTQQYQKLYKHFSTQNHELNAVETLQKSIQITDNTPRDYTEPKILTQEPTVKNKSD